jgi:hypothetical protein
MLVLLVESLAVEQTSLVDQEKVRPACQLGSELLVVLLPRSDVSDAANAAHTLAEVV